MNRIKVSHFSMCGYSLQYIFMFQWPFLPELLLSINDYEAFNGIFSQVSVRSPAFYLVWGGMVR